MKTKFNFADFMTHNQVRSHGVAFGAVAPYFFCLQKLFVPRNICFKLIINQKSCPLKMHFSQTPKPGYGPAHSCFFIISPERNSAVQIYLYRRQNSITSSSTEVPLTPCHVITKTELASKTSSVSPKARLTSLVARAVTSLSVCSR